MPHFFIRGPEVASNAKTRPLSYTPKFEIYPQFPPDCYRRKRAHFLDELVHFRKSGIYLRCLLFPFLAFSPIFSPSVSLPFCSFRISPFGSLPFDFRYIRLSILPLPTIPFSSFPSCFLWFRYIRFPFVSFPSHSFMRPPPDGMWKWRRSVFPTYEVVYFDKTGIPFPVFSPPFVSLTPFISHRFLPFTLFLFGSESFGSILCDIVLFYSIDPPFAPRAFHITTDHIDFALVRIPEFILTNH